MLEMLNDGLMEDRRIEMTIEHKVAPVMYTGVGMEHMDIDLQGMFEKILPKNTTRREMTVGALAEPALMLGLFASALAAGSLGLGRIAREFRRLQVEARQRPHHLPGRIRPLEPPTAVFGLRLAMYELDKLVREGISQEAFERTRNFLADMPPAEALEFLLDRMKRTKTNKEFLDSMARG